MNGSALNIAVPFKINLLLDGRSLWQGGGGGGCRVALICHGVFILVSLFTIFRVSET